MRGERGGGSFLMAVFCYINIKIGDEMFGKREGNKKRIIIKLVILAILIFIYFGKKYFFK